MPSVIQSPVLSPNSTQASIKLQSKGFINVFSLSGTLVFDEAFLSLSLWFLGGENYDCDWPQQFKCK